MKTPIEILESVAADIVENTSLLEVIYRNYELQPEADNCMPDSFDAENTGWC